MDITITYPGAFQSETTVVVPTVRLRPLDVESYFAVAEAGGSDPDFTFKGTGPLTTTLETLPIEEERYTEMRNFLFATRGRADFEIDALAVPLVRRRLVVVRTDRVEKVQDLHGGRHFKFSLQLRVIDELLT